MTKQGAQRPMKDSGVEWLGEVPAHWEVTPAHRVFVEGSERARPDDELLSATQKYGVISKSTYEQLEGRRVTHAQMHLDRRKHVEIGDFVISMRSFEGGIECAREIGCVRSSYVVLKPTASTHVGYFSYLFKSAAYIFGLQKTSTFIRDGQDLNFNNFRQVPLPIFQVSEQAAIADYLDRATTRIDALVAKKTRFIELLREKRQALITRAVTRGLDPAVPMKDSGVAWLGRVPAHWQVLRFKLSTKSCQNGTWGEEPKGDDDDIECVRVADFNRPTLAVNAVIPTLRAVTEKDRTTRLLRRGDLLLEKSGGGENQPVGQVVLYNRDQHAVCSNFVARIELQAGMEPRFWNYQHHVAYSARINVRSIKQTSGIQNLDHHQYLNELAVFPPQDEQVSIAVFLDHNTTRIDTLIAKTERSIELLREKRTALITAAVTGKLDLREAA